MIYGHLFIIGIDQMSLGQMLSTKRHGSTSLDQKQFCQQTLD
jgi:hypothetical protein